MKRIILIITVLLAMLGQAAYAQKTCVIASAEIMCLFVKHLFIPITIIGQEQIIGAIGRCAISLIQQPYRNLVL